MKMKKISKKVAIAITSVLGVALLVLCIFGIGNIGFNDFNGNNAASFAQKENVSSNDANSDVTASKVKTESSNDVNNNFVTSNVLSNSENTVKDTDEQSSEDTNVRTATIFDEGTFANTNVAKTNNAFTNSNNVMLGYKIEGDTLSIGNEKEGFTSFDSGSDAPWVTEENLPKIKHVIIVDHITPTATIGWFGCMTTPEKGTVVLANIVDIQNLDNLDMSKVADASFLFIGSDFLKDPQVSDEWFTKLSNVQDAFGICAFTKTLSNTFLNKMLNAIAGSVTNAYLSFSDNPKLTSVTFENKDTAMKNATNTSFMFYRDDKLTNITSSNLISDNATTVDGMFAKCHALTTITLDSGVNWYNMSTLTFSNRLFEDCTSLRGGNGTTFSADHVNKEYARIDGSGTPGYFTEYKPVPELYYMRARIDGGESRGEIQTTGDLLNPQQFNAGDTLSFSKIENSEEGYPQIFVNLESAGAETQLGCYQLKLNETYQLDKFTYNAGGEEIEIVDNQWYSVTNNTTITARTSEKPAEPQAYAVYDEGTSTLSFKYDVNKPAEGAYEIYDECAFEKRHEFIGKVSPTHIVITEQFKDFPLKNTAYMFFNLQKLTDIEGLSNLNTDNITSTSYMFFSCYKLQSIVLGDSFNTSNVTDMSYMFGKCRAFTELDLSKFDTSKVEYMYMMFAECKSLTKLNLNSFYTSQVTDMSSMFMSCTALSQITFGDNFNTSKVTSMVQMFRMCEALTNLNLCNFNPSKLESVDYMFFQCKNLVTIYCNSNWNHEGLSSGNMFANCEALKGGKGSTIASGIDASVAKPDGGADDPGLFTKPTIAATCSFAKNNTWIQNPTGYFTIDNGNTSNSYGPMTYKGITYDYCLKIETRTSIQFNCSQSIVLNLVTNTKNAGKNIRIDDAKYTIGDDGICSVELAEGSHTITKADVAQLYFIEIINSASTDSSKVNPNNNNSNNMLIATKPYDKK